MDANKLIDLAYQGESVRQKVSLAIDDYRPSHHDGLPYDILVDVDDDHASSALLDVLRRLRLWCRPPLRGTGSIEGYRPRLCQLLEITSIIHPISRLSTS